MALVSALTTALVTGAGAFLLFSKKCLSRKDHDDLCSLRTGLVQKDIGYIKGEQKEMKEDVKRIRADVDLLVRRNGGRAP